MLKEILIMSLGMCGEVYSYHYMVTKQSLKCREDQYMYYQVSLTKLDVIQLIETSL